MITLSDGTTTLTLHQLLWQNRSRQNAAGSERATLGGRLIIQRLATAAGQEITLTASLDGNQLRGWFTWGQVQQLKAWRDAGTNLSLNYAGDIRPCMIPLSGIDIEPVKQQSTTPDAAAICAGTLVLNQT